MAEPDALLDLALAKGLIDPALAREVAAEAAASGRDAAAILEARGILTPHITARLRAELGPAPPEIPGFLLGQRLGQGGMGTVYRAVQISVGRDVAVKVLVGERARDPAFAERFLREARTAAGINHPHVVTVYDAGRAGDALYLAMELVTGGDADRLARASGGRLPARRACQIVRDAARGLGALARAGLVHRDLKPANLFISADGSAKVADLGLARGTEPGEHLTVDGTVLGTPAFMSPEQARGDGGLDIRSDIHALGATLYALLTGRAPFKGNTPFAVTAQVMSAPFPDPRETEPSVPAAVAAVVLRATAKDRAARHADPVALERELDAVLVQLPPDSAAATLLAPGAGAILPPTASTVLAAGTAAPADDATAPTRLVAAPPPATAPPAPPFRRHRTWLLITIALALALGLLAIAIEPRPAAPPAIATVPVVPPPAAPASAEPAPAWAESAGRDAYGRWADLAVYTIKQRFRWIPPGSFLMGSPPQEVGRDDDETQHRVTLTRGFWLADSETTQEFWQAVANANPSHFTGDAQRPVDRVYQDSAAEFCARLEKLMPGLGVRLPSEAEWEYACRAGTTGATPGDLKAMAWCLQDYDHSATRAVKQGKPNAWGLYDMLGNSSEWTADTWAPFTAAPATDPLMTGGQFGVYRGGAFCSNLSNLRSAARRHDSEGSYTSMGCLRMVIPER